MPTFRCARPIRQGLTLTLALVAFASMNLALSSYTLNASAAGKGPEISSGATSESARPVVRELHFDKSRITLVVDPDLRLSAHDLDAYVKDAVAAVAQIYGELPVDHTIIKVDVEEGRGVGHATSSYLDEEDCGLIELSLGRHVSRATLDRSWTLTHELLHQAFPIVERSRRWLPEGIATYIEPIGRLRTGKLSPSEVWGELVENAPNGLPQENDGGLNHTRSWGRTYWGGALFCLLADIEIRKQTNNKLGLEHALRGIAGSGGTARSDWSAGQAISAGDEHLSVNVLQDLYGRMGYNRYDVDLHKLWRELGIKTTESGIVFDDTAPLAAIRKSIESGD
jgi:hypothetical protein